MDYNFLNRWIKNGEYSIVLGKRTILSAIISGIIMWMKYWWKSQTGLEISENDILKLYYEFDRFNERTKLNHFFENIDEDKFYEFLNGLLNAIDVEWDKNPEFLANRKLVWEAFMSLKQFVNAKWIKGSMTDNLSEELNQRIINNPELLDYKIKRDVDVAILDYEKKVEELKIESDNLPTYIESIPDGSYAQSILGGEIRIVAPWKLKEDDGSRSN